MELNPVYLMTSSALRGLSSPSADVTRGVKRARCFQEHSEWLESTLRCQVSAPKVSSCSMRSGLKRSFETPYCKKGGEGLSSGALRGHCCIMLLFLKSGSSHGDHFDRPARGAARWILGRCARVFHVACQHVKHLRCLQIYQSGR